MRKPNFFIVGAPKCGTTSLYSYLRTHPAVFLSERKEPNFFCDDYADDFRRYKTQKAYLEGCFGRADESHQVVGEGSVLYLSSGRALERIRDFNPRARILIAVREPVEMLKSLHNHLLYWTWEDERDLWDAWCLQEERREGKRIPANCPEPALLQYRHFCSLGTQVERAHDIFPGEQILTISLAELAESPLETYKRVLGFLGLQFDGRRDFPPVNEAKSPKYAFLSKLLMPLSRIGRYSDFWNRLKEGLGISGTGLISLLRAWNTSYGKQNRGLRPEHERALREAFEEERALLETYLDGSLRRTPTSESGDESEVTG